MTSSAIGLTRTAALLIAVMSKPYAGKLPACLRREKIAIRGANMRTWRGAGAAAQDHLSAHEFSVVLTQSARHRLVSRIRKIGAGGPLPDVAEQLRRLAVASGHRRGVQPSTLHEIALHRQTLCSYFPFEFGGQACAGPARKSVGFIEAYVTNRLHLFPFARA